jgi:hypothetical protein
MAREGAAIARLGCVGLTLVSAALLLVTSEAPLLLRALSMQGMVLF